MIGLLSKIWCVISQLHLYVLWALIEGVNLIVAGIGAVIGGLVSAIPVEMPEPPVLPAAFDDAVGWVAWVFPVGTVAAILVFALAAWVMFQAVALAMRWAKAL